MSLVIGNQILAGQVVLIEVSDNGKLTVSTPRVGFQPGEGPLTFQVDPNTTVAFLTAFLYMLQGLNPGN